MKNLIFIKFLVGKVKILPNSYMLSMQTASYIRCRSMSTIHIVIFSAVNYGGMSQFFKLNVFKISFHLLVWLTV